MRLGVRKPGAAKLQAATVVTERLRRVLVEKLLHGHFDIAFVDIGLPKPNGYEVAAQIRQQAKAYASC